MGKIEVKRTNKNYGLTLSGKLGSQPALEEEYVRKFVSTDATDGVTSLRTRTRRPPSGRASTRSRGSSRRCGRSSSARATPWTTS
jgi:hypothetical protein